MRAYAAAALAAAVLALPALVWAAPPPSERAAAARSDLRVKPTGPIAVEYRLAAPPSVGTPLRIEVTARVEAAASGLAIEANPSAPGSVLVTPPVLVAAGNGAYSWRITVVPLAAEAGYLNIIVAGEIDGLAQASSVTVSLRSASAPGTAPVAGRAPRETLIALPVREGP